MAMAVAFSRNEEVFARAERLYQETAAELTKLVPGADIRHIGSTAVPGCLTKGDVDIVVRVKKQRFFIADEALAGSFQRNPGSIRQSLPGRRKGADVYSKRPVCHPARVAQ